MGLHSENQPLPLTTDQDGVVRVAGTRVSLDTVISAFKCGATAEQIAHDYPVLPLADIYDVIGYYLHHRSEVERYLAEQRSDAERLQQEMEARFDPQGIRDRLLARRATEGQQVTPQLP